LLAVVFLLVSLVVLGLLRSVLHHFQSLQVAKKIVT
jgi:hypothetical protein